MPVYDVRAAAAELGLTTQRVWQLIKEGKLERVALAGGRTLLVTVDSVLECKRARLAKGPGERRIMGERSTR
jgi:hypothetical protein